MKLNICCGNKILDGYVNVDVQTYNGVKPDVFADARRLPFADGSADEVLVVHAIEHFYRWELETVLAEWLRVLKPGGKLILECPNLLEACRMYVEAHQTDPVAINDQVTMWPLYGDPRWKDPLMVHHWGYSPTTLAGVLREASFKDVKQEPAEFKLKEPRDMRITGVK